MQRTPTFRDAVRRAIKGAAVDAHPYFVGLRERSIERNAFIASQSQFFHAVTAFSRPMLLLASRTDDTALRLALVKNAWDEHGEGHLAASHQATFLAMLSLLRGADVAQAGAVAAPLDPDSAGAAVRAFNATLLGVCGHGDPVTGLAMLGVIEDLFAGISQRIGQGIVAAGWASRDALVHYAVHETLDVAHSEAFYGPLEARWSDPDAQVAIAAGLELGAHVFMRLYDGLYEICARASA